jgi:hypothetical protein
MRRYGRVMTMKWTIRLVLLAAALSVTLSAQTLTEHLQKGIFAEETLGDLAEAAKIDVSPRCERRSSPTLTIPPIHTIRDIGYRFEPT